LDGYILDLLGNPALFLAGLFASILLSIEFGRAVGRWRRSSGDSEAPGTGLMEGAVFALLGLLMAFTFSGAATRFEDRKALIVEEANNIGTAELRLDLLPPDAQPEIRAVFAAYVQSRIATYRDSDTPEEFYAAFKRSTALQARIWQLAVAGGSRPEAKPSANNLLLPALNAMFDITMTRGMMLRTHTPLAVYLVLWTSVLLASVLIGYAQAVSKRHSWIHIFSFAIIMSIALFVIVDIEYPRLGLINIDDFEAEVWRVMGKQ